jgi:hypothetical protein
MEKKKKYHFLYKITCRITNNYYIGVHSTSNLEDGYLGSGKIIKLSIKKHGKENHIIEILKFFDTSKEKYLAEKDYLTEEILSDVKCMNISYGGLGGIQNKAHYEKFMLSATKGFKEKLKDPEYRKKFTEKSYFYKLHKEGKALNWSKTYNWTGKNHKPETIEKMKLSKINHGLGESNSQFGTMWITNGTENKKIKADQVIPINWYKGRKIKQSN